MHWAVRGQNPIEKIYYATNADKSHMGMLRFKEEQLTQADALVANIVQNMS